MEIAQAFSKRSIERKHYKSIKGRQEMNNLLRGGLAGAAAYKFGGGIFSTILIFILVFWLLGKC